MEVTITGLRPGDDAAAHRLNRIAFGGTDDFDPDAPRPPDEGFVAAYAGDRLVGKVVTFPDGQWFGGGVVPMGGVSGVVAVPELRGRGVVRAMLHEALRRLNDDGAAVATLYPTTASLYRSVGFEIAGTWEWTEVPLGELASMGPLLDGHEVTEVDGDDPALGAPYEAMARQQSGWLERRELRRSQIRWGLDPARAPRCWSYLVHRDGLAVAALSVEYVDAPDGEAMYRLRVPQLAAVDGAALGAALAHAGRWGTTVDRVSTLVPRHLLAHQIPHAQRLRAVTTWPWMVRVVDLPAAIAARGWSPAVAAEVVLRVRDPLLAANDGTWVLSFAEGRGSATRGDADAATAAEIGIGPLSSWFSGFATGSGLAVAGWIAGASAADLAVLDAVVTGPPPTSVDFF